MLAKLINMAAEPVFRAAGRKPAGAKGIRLIGHRAFVSAKPGDWETLGRMQLAFLVGAGLRPYHVLFDVGCGCLRAGIHCIPYLERGHYMGIDAEQELLDRGVSIELGQELYERKAPELIASATFEFDRFSKQPDFAVAQSLFTHLVPDDIRTCLQNLRAVCRPSTLFYATYNQVDSPISNPPRSHPHGTWRYTAREMADFGATCGWSFEAIGAWGHPARQVMGLYRPVPAPR
jgi:SAM-dependent methyltransferase